MPTPRVIDLSHHNSIPEDLLETKDAGIWGIIHKCTEGDSYVDDKCQARHYLAKQANLLWGCYHFLNSKSSGATQAKFFAETMKRLQIFDKDTLVAADHEDSTVTLEHLREFMVTLRGITRRTVVLYSGHVLKDQLINYVGKDFPPRLWLAQYGNTPTL